MSYIGIACRRMKPTQKHVAAIWEGILGAVYARSPKGEVKYFDYDYEGAKAFAGIKDASDARTYRWERAQYTPWYGISGGYYSTEPQPRVRQLVLFVVHPK